MRSRRTESDRILSALQSAGARGVMSSAFDAPHVVDGGAPIRRLAARIFDLKERGFRVEAHRDSTTGLARYVLRSVVESADLGQGRRRGASGEGADRGQADSAPRLPMTSSPYDPFSDFA